MSLGLEKLSGSCLCGAVSYSISGDAQKFYHCHCKRCRKATGTGHASNIIMMDVEQLEWHQGEENLTWYKVPDAERFATNFCKTCGSLMPRPPGEAKFAVIPVGTMDHEPKIQPQARIFADSKSQWSCTDNDLPEFDQYPTG